jgi:hypothetical protein
MAHLRPAGGGPRECLFIGEDQKSRAESQNDANEAKSLQQLESNRKSNIKIEFT